MKTWIKKHKTGLLVGVACGVGLSALTYKMGLDNGCRIGFKKGYNEGLDFSKSEWELIQSSNANL